MIQAAPLASSSAAQPAPTTAVQRLETLDVLRGFALCGILLVNIIAMGRLWAEYFPPLPPTLSNPDWIAWILQHVFLQGTMRGLFTLLFGAGMLLITLRGDAAKGTIEAADVYFRRCLMLLAFGIFNFAVLLFPGDVLYVYGLSGLFLFVFRTARPRVLIAVAVMLILLLSAKTAVREYENANEARAGRIVAESQFDISAHPEGLTDEQYQALQNYQTAMRQREPTAQDVREEVDTRTGGYVSLLSWSIREWADYAASTYTVTLVMECVAFMLLGMALFKMGVLSGARSLRFYLGLMAVGYLIGLTVNGLQAVMLWRYAFSPELWLTRSTYELGRWGVTFGHVGLIISLWKMNALGVVGQGLKSIGRMALSNYLGQSAITTILFYGLGLWNRFGWWQLWGLAVLIWVFQAVFSAFWLKRYRFGPMEWLLRSVAYGRIQPMRRTAG